MSNKKILILDDEPLALIHLQDTISEVKLINTELNDFEVLATTNQNEFWKLLENQLPLIIFLDIQMPGKNGIEIAEEIGNRLPSFNYINNIKPVIIFCTAYDNFAYKAFKVDAFDYILKPIDNNTIDNLFKKLLSKINLEEIEQQTLKINYNSIDIYLPIKDILFFEAEMKYISVVTSQKTFIINNTIINLEEDFPSFIKTHRSFLINPIYVNNFFKKENGYFVSLKNYEKPIPVSRRQRVDLEKKIPYKNLFNYNI